MITPQTTIPDGTWLVGDEVTAGTYSATGGDRCYWARLSGFGGTVDDIIANDANASRPVVDIAPTDKGFETSGCGQWMPIAIVITPQTTIPDGTWLVGDEVTAWTYSAPGGTSCYWARLSAFSGTVDDIIASGFRSSRPVVDIDPTDAGFQTSGCGAWTPTRILGIERAV